MTNSWRGTNVSASSTHLEHIKFMKRIRKSLYYSTLTINCLSLPVTELAAELFTEVKSGHTLEKLDVEEASRISRNACVSPCSLVLALLYIERLKNCNPEYLHQVAPSELFLVSLLVASKFLHDDGEEDTMFFNRRWAYSGQMSISRMNKLEKDFLAAIDWTVLVQHEDFWERLQQLEKNVANREIHKRRWCTYTELSCLMNSVQLIRIAQTLISVSSICLATYAAGLATLLGSTLAAHFIVQSCLLGASLSSRQSTNLTSVNVTTNLMSIDLTDLLLNTRSQEINDDGLPISDSENVVDHFATVETENDDKDIASWKWWLNSTMIWLPVFCQLESDAQVKNSNRLCFTNVDFSFNSTQDMNTKKMEEIKKTEDFAPEDYHRNVNWKEILDTTVNWLMEDWSRSHYESVI